MYFSGCILLTVLTVNVLSHRMRCVARAARRRAAPHGTASVVKSFFISTQNVIPINEQQPNRLGQGL